MGLTSSFFLALFGAVLIDALALPRQGAFRCLAGTILLVLLTAFAFGLCLAAIGHPPLAAFVTLAANLVLVVVSNAKRRMLGEPLQFSDLALLGAVFRHPQFYFSALAPWQRILGLVLTAILGAALAWHFELTPAMHLVGAVISVAAILLLALSVKLPPFAALAAEPRAEQDVAILGLAPTLLLYWLRWRRSEDPPPGPVIPAISCGESDIQLIVAVQCESFADPIELSDETSFSLSGLEAARTQAMQWGNLLVSGFGAYTMRTEYGVLFGREEEELGFRRYDPFLTAVREGAYALPHRLGSRNWRSRFVHPHDMRFYNRHKILPEAGFHELISERSFPPPESGRYISDAAVADKVLALAGEASEPTFIYAVTIENHGPWSAGGTAEDESLLHQYYRLVRFGDAMLSRLQEGIAELRRPALLVFFGDHRPSIPGVCEPGGDRHTPYVMLQFDERGQVLAGGNQRRDITPAQLHHAILRSARGCPSFRD